MGERESTPDWRMTHPRTLGTLPGVLVAGTTNFWAGSLTPRMPPSQIVINIMTYQAGSVWAFFQMGPAGFMGSVPINGSLGTANALNGTQNYTFNTVVPENFYVNLQTMQAGTYFVSAVEIPLCSYGGS